MQQSRPRAVDCRLLHASPHRKTPVPKIHHISMRAAEPRVVDQTGVGAGSSAAGTRSLATLGGSAGLTPLRSKRSSVAMAQAMSGPVRKSILVASPKPSPGVDRQRSVAAHSWLDRAGPDFDPREYELKMKMQRGWDFKFRSDEYLSDSDASDFEDLPEVGAAELEPAARSQRFQEDTQDLLGRSEEILSASREVPFFQGNFIDQLGIRDHPGVCVGLSIQWLQSAHADPQMASSQRIEFLTSREQAVRILRMQSDSNRLHEQLAFHSYRPLQELSQISEEVRGVEFGKYQLCKGGPGVSVSDLSEQVAARLLHDKASTHNLITITPRGHAMTCERLDGRLRLFEPNSGVYDVGADQLSGLLAAVTMSHTDMTHRLHPDLSIHGLVERTEIRVIPVHISPT
ncbi:YopT-type cysteine protease domain-containing protein [Ideonella sp. YS5]|uniref:YopT-type cysteine protease domain-containing protein n=1 Tax=Ideonella sp. YS5 TaxID=3453714 RepID=UPI003EE9CC47